MMTLPRVILCSPPTGLDAAAVDANADPQWRTGRRLCLAKYLFRGTFMGGLLVVVLRLD